MWQAMFTVAKFNASLEVVGLSHDMIFGVFVAGGLMMQTRLGRKAIVLRFFVL